MLEKLKGTFDKSVATVSVKSGTMVEVSKTNIAISNAQKKLESGIKDLGQQLFSAWKEGPLELECFEESFQALKDIEVEIETLNKRLEEIKEEEARLLGTQQKQAPVAGSGVFCTNCGKNLPSGSRFCDGCGTPVK